VIELMPVGYVRDTFKLLASIMSLDFIRVATCPVSRKNDQRVDMDSVSRVLIRVLKSGGDW